MQNYIDEVEAAYMTSRRQREMREYNYHSFMRSFQLPETLNADAVEANYTDGILNILIPKKKEAVSRSITVE